VKWLFLPVPSGKPWTGSTIYTEALGGSEASVAFTALALAKAGEEVHVMTHGEAGKTMYEGVTYHGQHLLGELLSQKWDVVVSSRWAEILNDFDWQCKMSFWWLHDMKAPGNINIRAHLAVCLSRFQRSVWGLNESNCVLIGDGVDTEVFDKLGDVPRNENKLIWTSNPDRGLALAAKIFQVIRKRWPDLELWVYGRSAVYGWGPETEWPFMPRDEDMENVFICDPLPRAALFKELKTARAMFYPTYWPETYCMATLEAQAAGTPVVCSPYGALYETVKGGLLNYDFLNSISQLRNKRRWEKLSQMGLDWAAVNTWKNRAADWMSLARMVADAQP
jgi:glycosyltransferase involved in cell wall biosynthesis